MFARNLGDILSAFMNILASFQHDRANTQFNQSKGGKQTSRAGTYHNSSWFVAHILIVDGSEHIISWLFIDVNSQREVDIDGTLSGIDTPLEDADMVDMLRRKTLVCNKELLDALFVSCLFGQNSYLVFLNHSLIYSFII